MQLCFIVQNSIQMLQKATQRQISLFDKVKYSLQTLLRSLFQSNIISQNNVIHLFVTSSTQPISSYQHDELHLFHQIKSLQCTFPVFPSEVIQSALNHIGKFRCLDQSQTFLGYRKGQIQDPTLVFYITGRSNQRQINKIYNLIQLNKLQLRAEYKFITIKFGSSTVNQGHFLQDKLLIKNENMKQYYRTNQVMKLINGCLICAYQPATLMNLIKKQIRSFKPALTIQMQQKDYKIHNKQLIKTQIPINMQEKYSCLLKQMFNSFNNIYATKNSFFINSIPCIKGPLVPLPFQMTPRFDANSQLDAVRIQKFFPIKFFIDFHKEYIGKLFSMMKFFFDKYQVQQSKLLNRASSFMATNNIHEKKFPVFYQPKKNQPFLIGFLRLSFQSSGRAIWQLHISFSNFVNLNSHIKAYKQGQANAQQYFQNYMSSLPIIYVKFLRLYLQHFGININTQTNQSNSNKMLQMVNKKYYQQNFNQQTLLRNQFSIKKQQHQNNQSKCCSIYSSQFQKIQSKKLVYQRTTQNHQINQFLYQKLRGFQTLKKQLCQNDYFITKNVKSLSIKQQVDKYKIRRDDHQLDQIVGDLLGNPFKKIYKKVKIDDQAESIWIDQAQIDQMKDLFQQQTDLVQKIQYQNSDKLTKTSDKPRSRDNLYDKLVNTKQKLKKDIIISEDIIKYIQLDIQQKLKQDKIQIEEKEYSAKPDIKQSLRSTPKPIILLQQDNKQNQSQKLSIQSKPNLQKNLQIINEVNKSFKMNKYGLFGLPSQLVNNDLFLKNKTIFDEIIGPR